MNQPSRLSSTEVQTREPADVLRERLLAVLLRDLEREAAGAKGPLAVRYRKGTPLGWEPVPGPGADADRTGWSARS